MSLPTLHYFISIRYNKLGGERLELGQKYQNNRIPHEAGSATLEYLMVVLSNMVGMLNALMVLVWEVGNK